jgi:hypothetical protein
MNYTWPKYDSYPKYESKTFLVYKSYLKINKQNINLKINKY